MECTFASFGWVSLTQFSTKGSTARDVLHKGRRSLDSRGARWGDIDTWSSVPTAFPTGKTDKVWKSQSEICGGRRCMAKCFQLSPNIRNTLSWINVPWQNVHLEITSVDASHGLRYQLSSAKLARCLSCRAPIKEAVIVRHELHRWWLLHPDWWRGCVWISKPWVVVKSYRLWAKDDHTIPEAHPPWFIAQQFQCFCSPDCQVSQWYSSETDQEKWSEYPPYAIKFEKLLCIQWIQSTTHVFRMFLCMYNHAK